MFDLSDSRHLALEFEHLGAVIGKPVAFENALQANSQAFEWWQIRSTDVQRSRKGGLSTEYT